MIKRSRRQVLSTSAATFVAAAAQTRLSSAQTAPPPAEDRARMLELIEGYRVTQMVHVAAKLRIADHLTAGPRTVQELATLTSTHADSLYRLLRTLAGWGIFAEEAGPAFRLTPMAGLLRSGVPASLRVNAEVAGESWMWRPWGHLMHSVKTGEVAFDNLYGKHTWEWFAENPGPAQLFDSFMAQNTSVDTRTVLAAYDFDFAQTVVDIGGGHGVLLAAVLGAHTKARGILFDMPHVVETAKSKLPAPVARRIEFAPGDFFKSVPSGGDLYMLKHIIHDWTDEDARKILAVVHRAMNGRGRLILIELLICEPNRACQAKSSDMQMMVRNGGRNRTEREYRDLLQASGFNVTRVVPTTGPAIIESVPA